MDEKLTEESLFDLLVLSLCNATIMGLGLASENGEKNDKNLEVAKHNIDMLAMLQQKTAGNLSQHEKQLLDSVLYDLRLKFVEASR